MMQNEISQDISRISFCWYMKFQRCIRDWVCNPQQLSKNSREKPSKFDSCLFLPKISMLRFHSCHAFHCTPNISARHQIRVPEIYCLWLLAFFTILRLRNDGPCTIFSLYSPPSLGSLGTQRSGVITDGENIGVGPDLFYIFLSTQLQAAAPWLRKNGRSVYEALISRRADGAEAFWFWRIRRGGELPPHYTRLGSRRLFPGPRNWWQSIISNRYFPIKNYSIESIVTVFDPFSWVWRGDRSIHRWARGVIDWWWLRGRDRRCVRALADETRGVRLISYFAAYLSPPL